jgi:hypothetical protein
LCGGQLRKWFDGANIAISGMFGTRNTFLFILWRPDVAYRFFVVPGIIVVIVAY